MIGAFNMWRFPAKFWDRNTTKDKYIKNKRWPAGRGYKYFFNTAKKCQTIKYFIYK